MLRSLDLLPDNYRYYLLLTSLSKSYNQNHFFFNLRFQGICPGNRLKLLPTSYDSSCFTPSPMSSPCPSSIGTTSIYASGGSTTGSASMSSGSSAYILPNDLYENTSQKHSKRRSWHIMPNKVHYLLLLKTNSILI